MKLSPARALNRPSRPALGWLLAYLLVAVLTPLAVLVPAQAETNGAMPSTNDQILYAYTDDGGTIDVSATFQGIPSAFDVPGWNKNLLAKAVIKVTDPAGKLTTLSKNFDGSSDVTVAQTDLTSSDGKGGVWKVQIMSLNSSGDPAELNGGEGARTVVTPWSVVPRQGGTAMTGRVWAEALNSFQASKLNLDTKVDFTTYNLSSTGVLYKNTYRDFLGLVSTLTTDDLGMGDANCEPTYRSWSYGSGTTLKRADACASATTYRIFFSKPDSTMPANARAWDGSTDWVYPQYKPATVSGVMLVEAQTLYHSGTLRASVGNQKGTLTFDIDTNFNGSFTDPVDRSITVGDVNPGTVGQASWDGKDGAGNLIDRRTRNIRLRATLSNVGEIHFIRKDVEISAGGLEVEQMTGPEAGSQVLSWDDSQVGTKCLELQSDGTGYNTVTCTGAATNPKKADRSDSAGGVHAWDSGASDHQGGWGDSRYIDDWTSFGENVTTSAVVFDEPDLYPDLTVGVDDGLSQLAPLDSTTYTVTAINSHAWLDEANGTLIAYLPAGLTFQNASDGGTWNAAARTVTWTGVPVAAAGGTASRTLTVNVDRTVARPATLDVYATAQATQGPAPTSDPAAGCTGTLCATDTDTVPAANLSIGKDDNLTTINRGNTVTWTLSATNRGTVNEPETLVVDTLPAGYDYVSSSNSGSWDAAARTITWPRFALGAGTSATRSITATVRTDTARPATMTNFATITATNGTPADPTLGCAAPGCAADTDQTVAPQLQVAKSDGRTVVNRGQQVVYTITARNNGTVTETGATVLDTLPASLTYTASTGAGTYSAATRTVTWTLDLAAGASRTVTVTGTVNPNAARPSTLTNYATIAALGDTPDDPALGCAAPTCAADTDQLPAADLMVTKTDGTLLVNRGDNLTYKVTVTNRGQVPEDGTTIVDTLPAGLTFTSATGGGVHNPAAHTVTWSGVNLAAGATITRDVTVTVDMAVPRPAELTNWVMAAGTGDTPGDPLTDCTMSACASDTDETVSPNLAVTKTDGRALINRGDTTTYTITATNNAVVPEHGASIVDTLPAGMSVVSASDGGTVDAVARTVTWPVDLAAGGTTTRTLTVRVDMDTPRPANLTNFAVVAATGDQPTDPAGGCTFPVCATDTDQTVPLALSIAKGDGRVIVEPDDTLTWSLVVSNSAPVEEAAVTVVDTLPAEVEFVDASDAARYNPGNGQVVWSSLRVTAGGSITLTMTGKVRTDVARPVQFTNRAAVAGPGELVADPTVACDAPTCARDTDQTMLADLRIVTTVTDSDLTDGGKVSWRVDVSNESPVQRARNVAVTDMMPTQVDPVSVQAGTASQGTFSGATWQVGELPPGSTASITLTGTIKAPDLAARDTIVNTARVTSLDDPAKGDPAQPCVDNDLLIGDTDGCDLVTLHPDTPLLVATDDGADTVDRDDILTYQVMGVNSGRVAENQAVLTAILPATVTFQAASDGGTFDATTNTIVWPAEKIVAGQSATHTVTVTVNGDAPRLAQFTEYATIHVEGQPAVDPAAGCAEPACASDTDTVKAQPKTGTAWLDSGQPGNQDGLLVGLGVVVAAAGAGVAVAGMRRRRTA